jgi:hypothetical protein
MPTNDPIYLLLKENLRTGDVGEMKVDTTSADTIEKVYEFKISAMLRDGNAPLAWENPNQASIKLRLGCFESSLIINTLKTKIEYPNYQNYLMVSGSREL